MRRFFVLFLLAAVLTVILAPVASGATQESFTGTYHGTVTTSSGRKVPVTVYIKDKGSTADVTVQAEGYSASTVAKVTRSGGTVKIAASVNAPSVVKGSGQATLTRQGDKWVAAGTGSGTALAKYNGTAAGTAERTAADFSASPAAGTGAIVGVSAVDTALRPLAASASQPPISDTERIAAAGAAVLFSLLFLLTGVFMGAPAGFGGTFDWL